MSLARGPQQPPIIRKPPATTGSLLATRPQILTSASKAKASATLVSRAVSDRIVVGSGKLPVANASRPLSLRKPIVKPPKDSVAQAPVKIPQHSVSAAAARGGIGKGGMTGAPKPAKPVVSILPVRKSLGGSSTVDVRRSISAVADSARTSTTIVNKAAIAPMQRASAGPLIVDTAQKRLSTDAGRNVLSRNSMPSALTKGKVVITMRTPRTTSTEAPSTLRRESLKTEPPDNSARAVGSSARGARGSSVCVMPKGRAQIVGVNRDRNTPAIVRRGIGVLRGGHMPGGRPASQQPISSSFPMVSRSGVPLIGRPQRRRMPGNADPYGLDEMTAEDLDFIDDGGEENDTNEWLHELRGVTGYDPSKFRGVDEARESNHTMMAYEERLSAQIARREDLEEFKKAAQESSDSDEED